MTKKTASSSPRTAKLLTGLTFGGGLLAGSLMFACAARSPGLSKAEPPPPSQPAVSRRHQAPPRPAEVAAEAVQKAAAPAKQGPRTIAMADEAGAAVAGKKRSKPASVARRAKDSKLKAQSSGVLAQIAAPEEEKSVQRPSGEFQGRDRKINGFDDPRQDPLSTFAVDVDTASYSIARRSLNSGRLPTPSLVRVEEFLNYFRYDYQAPQGQNELFSIQVDGAQSPYSEDRHLLRVGIQARKVSDAQRLPTNLVFLVDTSCSMSSGDKLALAKESLKVAVERLNDRDQVAITTYAGGVRLVLPPTPGHKKEQIIDALDSLRSGGGTAMSSGMQLAYQQAQAMHNPGELTRVIVLSDGDANIGATSPHHILDQIKSYVSQGITMSTIGFGDGNYKDMMMEQLANKGNGNYYYVDTMRQARRVFGQDLTKMLQDVARDVKIQVEFEPGKVKAYRLVGYENRNVADKDFRNDQVDAGEIGAGHQVTALYELVLAEGAQGNLATVRVRAKKEFDGPAKETELAVNTGLVQRNLSQAAPDMRFAAAVMGWAELLRRSPYSEGITETKLAKLVDQLEVENADQKELRDLLSKSLELGAGKVLVGQR